MGKEVNFRGRLRPFFDAGSWDSTRYVVWLGEPFLAKGDTVGPFTFGHEFYSRPGNVDGSIADGLPYTFRVTFDGKPQAEAFFAVAVEKPIRISKAVYAVGNIFHDGGWFDASGGKPKFQIKRTADGPWVDVAVFEDYPAATATDAKGIGRGHVLHREVRAGGGRCHSHHRQAGLGRQSGASLRFLRGTDGNGRIAIIGMYCE